MATEKELVNLNQNKMKTAVEWYNAKLNAIDFKLNSGLINYEQCKVEMSEAFEQAKEMEKEQIIEAHGNKQRTKSNPNSIVTYGYTYTGEMYYNDKFKSE
jgi:hypothetical protein